MGFAPGRHRCELDPMLDDPELLLCRSLRLTEKHGSPGLEAMADLGLLKARREMAAAAHLGIEPRSEDHTPELQPLMRSSYDVLCLQQQHRQDLNMQLRHSNYLHPYMTQH